MKKVLFISYFFPPLGGAGVHRSLKFVKYLKDFGWLPVVISASENVNYIKEYNLLNDIPSEVEVHRVGYKESELPKELLYLRDKIKIFYDFPDVFKNWYHPVYQEAKRILQESDIDLIFSTSSPFTSHLIAMRLNKEFNIPWVADFRDPWSGNSILDMQYKNTLIKPLRHNLKLKIRNAEREILETASKSIVVAWHHKKQLHELHNIQEDKVEVITNGYDESDFDNVKANSLYPNKLTITYVGSFYSGYKPIILNFLNSIKELNREVEIVFIGRSASEMQNIGDENVTCIYNLPKKKLFSFCLSSDFTFIIAMPSGQWEIHGKIFEYLRLGKPIIGLCPDDGDAARIIKEAKAGFILSYDKEKMKQQLNDIFKRWENGEFKNFQPDLDYISQYERKRLTQRLSVIFNEVVG